MSPRKLLTLPESAEGGLRLLVLGAHSDDIEIGCGGTILRLAQEGRLTSVDWIVLSASEQREREARAGARGFLGGVEEHYVEIHAFRDGFFPYDGGRIKEAFEELKARPAPDLILTHRREDLHQDHRLVSELTWNTFRDQLILEYEIPKYDGDLGPMNLYVEISQDITRQKIALILDVFQSQARRRWFSEDAFRAILRMRGVESNAASGLAEAFVGRKIVL